jgi:hypothetical protein
MHPRTIVWLQGLAVVDLVFDKPSKNSGRIVQANALRIVRRNPSHHLDIGRRVTSREVQVAIGCSRRRVARAIVTRAVVFNRIGAVVDGAVSASGAAVDAAGRLGERLLRSLRAGEDTGAVRARRTAGGTASDSTAGHLAAEPRCATTGGGSGVHYRRRQQAASCYGAGDQGKPSIAATTAVHGTAPGRVPRHGGDRRQCGRTKFDLRL